METNDENRMEQLPHDQLPPPLQPPSTTAKAANGSWVAPATRLESQRG